MVLLRTAFLVLIAAAGAWAQDPIRSGEQFVEAGRLSDAMQQFEKAIAADPNNSLAHYRLGEVLWTEKQYQRAANELQECLNGDQQPRWTTTWAHIRLGMIFDLTAQRGRALEHYRLAIRTGDDRGNAQEIAKGYLERAYERPEKDR
jgi:tetratricopeptide (TPR) repeat protein